MCKRQVFDLTSMSDTERLAFVAGCGEEVCVSYSIPIGPALRAAALAAALAAPSAATARPQPPAHPPIMVPVAGGIAPPPEVRIVELPKVAAAEDLRRVYEDRQEGKPDSDREPAPKRDD
ncbi:MAG TPA: hypothetical protein VF577_07025 [Allosphingosinicella sp.]